MQAIFRKNLIMSFSLKSIHEFKTWNRYLLEQMKKKKNRRRIATNTSWAG